VALINMAITGGKCKETTFDIERGGGVVVMGRGARLFST